jgi:hypothetical protein
MKYLYLLSIALVSVSAQNTHMFLTRDGGEISQTMSIDDKTVLYTCFSNKNNASCIYKMNSYNVYAHCESNKYGNGKKQSSTGECCSSSSDCKDSCVEFICASKDSPVPWE